MVSVKVVVAVCDPAEAVTVTVLVPVGVPLAEGDDEAPEAEEPPQPTSDIVVIAASTSNSP